MRWAVYSHAFANAYAYALNNVTAPRVGGCGRLLHGMCTTVHVYLLYIPVHLHLFVS